MAIDDTTPTSSVASRSPAELVGNWMLLVVSSGVGQIDAAVLAGCLHCGPLAGEEDPEGPALVLWQEAFAVSD